MELFVKLLIRLLEGFQTVKFGNPLHETTAIPIDCIDIVVSVKFYNKIPDNVKVKPLEYQTLDF